MIVTDTVSARVVFGSSLGKMVLPLFRLGVSEDLC